MKNLTAYKEKLVDYKNRSNEISNILTNSTDYRIRDKADAINHCSDWFDIENLNNGTDHIKNSFCRERFCPQCQYRRSLKEYGKIIQIAETIQGAWLHCVLTVRNCEASSLGETICLLHKKSSALFKKYKQFKGIIRATEISYNAVRDDFHPHLHCLILVNKSYFKSRYYISQSALLDKWQSLLTGTDSGGGLYISKVTNKSSSVAEVCKYCLKPLEIDGLGRSKALEVYETIMRALKGRRLLQTYGECQKALKSITDDFKPVKDQDVLCSTKYFFDGFKYVPVAIDNRTNFELTNLKKSIQL